MAGPPSTSGPGAAAGRGGPAPAGPVEARQAGGLRSRVVAVAKVALPILALALLSTVFLMAQRVDPDAAIPFADVDVAMRARDQQLTEPRVSGVSADGTAFRLHAAAARPDPGDPRRLSADVLTLRLDGAGGTVAAEAMRGAVDTAARSVELEGGVRIETSRGYRLETERLEGTLGALDVRSPGPVRGEGPPGTISAGAMTVAAGPDGAPVMRFTGGVELVYLPGDP
jgi:lipopolysaccharide export system protein LptC